MQKKKRKKYISQHFLGLLLFSLINVCSKADAQTSKPKLVVGIMVEGLTDDYINLLEKHFGDGGFNRISEEGVVFTNVDYGPDIDGAAAAAIIYTGASPTVNGIFSNNIYNPKTKKITHILNDTLKNGSTAIEIYSPKAISVTTLSDEIRLDASGTGNVYSIAPEATQAIIAAGHAGNSAFWINDKNGQWSSSNYYKEIPQVMSTRNFRRPLSTVLDTLHWTPLLSPRNYPDIPDYKIQYPFKYNFSRKSNDRFKQFKSSAIVNEEITAIGCELINSLALNQKSAIDMVNLTFTVAPFQYSANSDNRMEIMDSYLRLDRDIAKIIKTAEDKAGKGNVLIFIAGYPASRPTTRDDDKWGIPTGDFSPRRAISLLNMYLMALHGNGNWINGYFDRSFYLNHDLIKDHQLNVADVRREAAEFLSRMSGISTVMTIDDILSSRASDNPSALKRNVSPKSKGDVIINLIPGWAITDDVNQENTKVPQVYRDNFTPSTVMIMAPGITAKKIEDKLDARFIAPTVARLARIRPPNAASLPAVRL